MRKVNTLTLSNAFHEFIKEIATFLFWIFHAVTRPSFFFQQNLSFKIYKLIFQLKPVIYEMRRHRFILKVWKKQI